MRDYPPTPGPWYTTSGQVVDGRGNILATRHSWRHLSSDYPKGNVSPTEADSNGHLMAAAPSLLKAVEALLKVRGDDWSDTSEKAAKMAEAAIAKAKGGAFLPNDLYERFNA